MVLLASEERVVCGCDGRPWHNADYNGEKEDLCAALRPRSRVGPFRFGGRDFAVALQ